MDVSQFLGGSLLTHVDLPQPVQQWTIGKVDQQMVGQGQQAEQKICITFNEFPSKPLALNKTNLKRVAGLYTVQATHWGGKQMQVYRSATTFQGASKLCVRVCGPGQVPPDPICDPQGAPVLYQPPAATVAPQPPAQPVQQTQAPAAPAQSAQQQPVAPLQPAAAPVQAPQQPVAAPQPAQQQPAQPDQAPWEATQQPQQTNPPSA